MERGREEQPRIGHQARRRRRCYPAGCSTCLGLVPCDGGFLMEQCSRARHPRSAADNPDVPAGARSLPGGPKASGQGSAHRPAGPGPVSQIAPGFRSNPIRAGVRGSDARGATSLRGRARVSCEGLAPPTPPSRTSTLRGSGPPTHPRIFFYVGASPPRPRPDRQPEHSPRAIARPLWGLCPHPPARTARPAAARAFRLPLPSRERAGVRGRRAAARPARAGDDRRTRWLESRGYRVLGCWNDDVLLRLTPVLEAIALELREPPPEAPSP